MKTFNKTFKSSRVSTSVKVRVYKTYVEPIFLYNCELWTITPTIAKQINCFHRRQLRTAINVKYPKIIKNVKLYAMIKTSEITTMRLHEDTPAKGSISEAIKPYERRRGRASLTWLKLIFNDLTPTRKEHQISDNINEENLIKLAELASNRKAWYKEVMRSMGAEVPGRTR